NVGTNDQCFERSRTDTATHIRNDPTHEAVDGATHLRHGHGDLALSRLDRLDAAAVATTGRRRRALVPPPAKERRHLVFKGALQDQSGAQTTKLSELLVVRDTLAQQVRDPRFQGGARGYPLHGVRLLSVVG